MRTLITFLILLFSSSLVAESLCTLVSEEDPEVTITITNDSPGASNGTMNFKNEPSFYFSLGISNGFGNQYYVLRKIPDNAIKEVSKITYLDISNAEIISEGRFVNFLNNKIGRTIDKNKPDSRKLKAFMPSLAQDYYYYLSPNARFNMTKKMKSIVIASEGFFNALSGCDKNVFAYG